MFYAIATLLEKETWQNILNNLPEGQAWVADGKIEKKFPHFSWMVGGKIDHSLLTEKLERISHTWREFPVINGGIGIFPGNQPVFALNLVRNEALCLLQRAIWDACSPCIQEINMHYSPEAWIPHITLLHYGIQTDQYCQFLKSNLYREFKFTFMVNNLSILYRSDDEIGQTDTYLLQKV